MFYRCIPNFAEETAAGVFADTGVKSFFEEIVADISGSAKEIIYMCLVALGTIHKYHLDTAGHHILWIYIVQSSLLSGLLLLSKMSKNHFSFLFFFAGLSIVITILFRFLAGIIVYVIIFAVAGAAIVGIALTW